LISIRQARSRAQFPPSRFLPPHDFDYLAQARLARATARTITRVEQFALHSIQLGLVQALTRALAAPFLTRQTEPQARKAIFESYSLPLWFAARVEQTNKEDPSHSQNAKCQTAWSSSF